MGVKGMQLCVWGVGKGAQGHCHMQQVVVTLCTQTPMPQLAGQSPAQSGLRRYPDRDFPVVCDFVILTFQCTLEGVCYVMHTHTTATHSKICLLRQVHPRRNFDQGFPLSLCHSAILTLGQGVC
jgi:hypothetical protein